MELKIENENKMNFLLGIKNDQLKVSLSGNEWEELIATITEISKPYLYADNFPTIREQLKDGMPDAIHMKKTNLNASLFRDGVSLETKGICFVTENEISKSEKISGKVKVIEEKIKFEGKVFFFSPILDLLICEYKIGYRKKKECPYKTEIIQEEYLMRRATKVENRVMCQYWKLFLYSLLDHFREVIKKEEEYISSLKKITSEIENVFHLMGIQYRQ